MIAEKIKEFVTSIVDGKREYIKAPRLLVPYEIADVIALRDVRL